jgi:YihY family inner membrane protein
MNESSPEQDSMMVAGKIRPRPVAPLSRPNWFGQKTRRVWTIFYLAVKKFLLIDGVQWAGSFAFNTFFALFPLLVMLITITSFFIDQENAGKEVVAYIESFIPISGEMQHHVFDTIAGVIEARKKAGAVAFLLLVWVALQSFITLIYATNKAWGAEVYSWWRLPLKSLLLLGITVGFVLLGIAVPVLMRIAKSWLLTSNDFHSWLYQMGSFFVPLLIVFFSLSMFYRFAPRRTKAFNEVWVAALCTTVLLRLGVSLFVIYLENFTELNAVYGVFGGIMALLLWIYISGCFLIFGACVCVSQAEMRSLPVYTNVV